MLAVFGVDVLDPRTSLRRIHVLMRRLPAGALPRVEAAAAWSVEAHLLAGVLDSLAALTYVTVKAHGGKPTRPKPVPRPGQGQRAAAPMSWGQVGRALVSTDGMVVRRGR